jgi:hypothetical protein
MLEGTLMRVEAPPSMDSLRKCAGLVTVTIRR